MRYAYIKIKKEKENKSYLSHCWYHTSGCPSRETIGIGNAVKSATAHTAPMIHFACLEFEYRLTDFP